ncbi:hypothetical protein [Falsiroseomonas sp. CW058]|uniref:hypothetical protein n=1 Tax=Falsiroseomonas sp. CW058 TaxID=3388664 RepID=UPI003D312842
MTQHAPRSTPTRRGLLAGLGVLAAAPSRAQPRPPVSVGAIRWDAWYAPGSGPTEAMARALSPAPWRARAPFFAEVPADGAPVRFPAPTQAVMDRQVDLAARSGLDYWAFLSYPRGSSMSEGFRLYRASAQRSRVRFCFVTELVRWGRAGAPSDIFAEHPPLMTDRDYMTAAGGRPLYFLAFLSDEALADAWGGTAGLRAAIDEFRARVQAFGGRNPYIVVMTPVPDQARRWVPLLGADAVSAYALQAGAREAPYAALATHAERAWAAHAALGISVVPTAMTGWDRRPRVQNPVPWEGWQRPGEGMDRWYAAATPAELAAHVGRAVEFAARQAPRTALLYAWNENDEGGHLVPTHPFDDTRLRALRGALCEPRPADRCVRRGS